MKKMMKMKSKCSYIIYILLLALGIFTVLQYLQADMAGFIIYATSVGFLWWFSVSDIKTRTVSALLIYVAMGLVFLLRFYLMCNMSVKDVPMFLVKSMIVFIIFYILSKVLKNKIGNGDFDVAYIIYLCIGLTGLFYTFVIACLLSLIFSLKVILKEHKNLKSQSIPFIPYMYIGYSVVLLLAKELIFI